MTRRIALIQGHPDAEAPHFCHALAEAYGGAAAAAGHELRRIDVARLEFPLLRSPAEWRDAALPESLAEAQRALGGAEHLVLIFPLWLGDMPALFKGFLEQVMRPGFAFREEGGDPFGHRALTGRSARIVVTMGMPAAVYRHYFRAHSLRSLERNILGFVGIAPINETLIGSVESCGDRVRRRWLERLKALGAQGA